MIKLAIADDDALVRSALGLMLDGQHGITVVGEATNGEEAVEVCRTLHPDVVLMDIRMPVVDGLEATRRLRKQPGPPKVIMLTTFDADDYVLHAINAGAEGFLLKDTPPATIADAVVKVHAGEPMLSPHAITALIRQSRRAGTGSSPAPARQRLAQLTDRERDVADGIGQGLSNAEIGDRLHLSVPTVKSHVTRIFDKLAVTNRVQIALLVRDAAE